MLCFILSFNKLHNIIALIINLYYEKDLNLGQNIFALKTINFFWYLKINIKKIKFVDSVSLYSLVTTTKRDVFLNVNQEIIKIKNAYTKK